NKHEADRHNEFQALFGKLKVSKFPCPNEPVSWRQLHVFSDLFLRFSNGASEVSIAHAELDRDEALHALVIYPCRSSIQSYSRHFAQGNVSVGAAARLIGHLDVPDFVYTGAVLRRETDHQV